MLYSQRKNNNRSSKKHSSWYQSVMTMFVISSRVEGSFIFLALSKNLIIIWVRFSLIGGSDYKLIYRHYATLYFVFCVDSSESELGILDLIQVFFICINTQSL